MPGRYPRNFWFMMLLNLLLLGCVVVLTIILPGGLGSRYTVNVMFALFTLTASFGYWYTQPRKNSGVSAFDVLCEYLMGGKADRLTPPERSSRKSAIALHSGLVLQVSAKLAFELFTTRNFARIGAYAVLLALSLCAFTIYRKDKLAPREGALLMIVAVVCPVVLYIYENGSALGVSNSTLMLLLLPILLSLFLFDAVRTRIVLGAFSLLLFALMLGEIRMQNLSNLTTQNYSAIYSFFICMFSLTFSVFTALELHIKQSTSEYYNLSGALRKLQDAQSMLVHHEKMVTLGQLIAGVAHEINTPIGAVKASAETLHSALMPAMTSLLKNGRDMSDEEIDDFAFLIDMAIESFKEMNSSMSVRRAKNTLRAYFTEQGVADPNGFAEALSRVELVNVEKVKQNIDIFQKETCARNLELLMSIVSFINGTQTILFASEKVTKIVFALRSYAHTNVTGESLSFDVAKTIDNVLVLYHNQLKMGVHIVKNYDDDLPEIVGNADELGQVWTNLIQNALQSMNNSGQLHVSIGRDGENFLAISFADTGCGISQENAAKIFDPFYTTKALGEGTGLGLDISRTIIEKHGGSIKFTSKVGVGTTFTVKLPINNKEANNG